MSENKYTWESVTNFPANDPRADQCRAACEGAAQQLYTGWETEYDQQWDSRALWFAIFDQDDPEKVLACCRLVFRHDQNGVQKLPCEDYLRRNNREKLPFRSPRIQKEFQYERGSTDKIPAMEATGVFYRDLPIFYLLIEGMSYWLQENQNGPCFAIVDKGNPELLDIHWNVILSRSVSGIYKCKQFRYRDRDVPVMYRLVVINAEDHEARVARIRAELDEMSA